MEILGVNIQYWRLSKRKMEKSKNVLESIGKLKKKRKCALIKSIAYNFWNVSNGMVCTISFSNQNFRVFRVNGKRLRGRLQPRYHSKARSPSRQLWNDLFQLWFFNFELFISSSVHSLSLTFQFSPPKLSKAYLRIAFVTSGGKLGDDKICLCHFE